MKSILILATGSMVTMSMVGDPDGKQALVSRDRQGEAPGTYEVETHRFISMAAAAKSDNLRAFVHSSGLRGRLLAGSTAYVLIGQGAIDEDDCEWCVSGLGFGTRRFMRHFYDPLDRSGLTFLGHTWSSAVTWGFEDTENQFRWPQIHAIAMEALISPERAVREDAARLLFLGVGHQVHLIQDMCQPSHTRKDDHNKYVGDASALEVWGGQNATAASHAVIRDAVYGATPGPLPSARDYYVTAAYLSNRFFFSDDTVFSYPDPNWDNTDEEPAILPVSMAGGGFELHGFKFIAGNVPFGDRPARLARWLNSQFARDPAQVGPWEFTLHAPDDSIVKDNARSLLRMATSLSAGFMDFLFRGRLEVGVGFNEESLPALVIKNASNPSRVHPDVGLDFSNGMFRIFYDTVSGRRLPLPNSAGLVSQETLTVGGSRFTRGNMSTVVGQLLDPAQHPDPDTRMDLRRRLTVVYEGNIGSEPGFAVGSFDWVQAPVVGVPPIVAIPRGSFAMGSGFYVVQQPQTFRELPVHMVHITRPFAMGSHEVTQAEYQAVMGANPSHYVGASRPVERVTWDEAMAYCAALTARSVAAGTMTTGYEFRLPTEAEWEYACRAGTVTEWNVGAGLGCGQANHYSDTLPGYCVGQTTVVGSYPANAWGLHDMHGNVWEWCLDRWDYSDNYPAGAVSDPFVNVGNERVMRGGGWDNSALICRSARRQRGNENLRDDNLGFRIVLAPIIVR